MKKFFALFLTLAMVLSLAACGAKEEAPAPAEDPKPAEESAAPAEPEKPAELPTLNFWANGSQNVADVWNEVIADYNARPDRACNVQLQFVLSGTGEASMISRYAAAFITGKDNSFDVMAFNGTDFLGYVDECGTEDAFLDLDTSKIPNYGNVKMSASVYPEKLLPYRGTTVVFSYDSEKLPNPPQTWDELVEWIKANPGKFNYNDPSTGGAGQAFVYNALYRLIDDPDAFANAGDEKYLEMLDPGFAWLADIHPYIYTTGGHVQYAIKNQGALDLLAAGETWITPAWADGTLDGLEKGTLPASIKMYQLSDLSLTGTDVDMAICATTLYPEACYDFINYAVSTEAQQTFVEVMKAVPVIDASLLEQTDAVKIVSTLNPAEFNILSVGANGGPIKDRWAEEIATLG